ncbi:MAG: DUF1934 domain-containing protein [Clostridiales bacterium]|jgi:uncharacterized beta-barrel protein YwiB (DUF1934 family)|nr:DUF1934 domain-containing protein [Clostridiales bacterium]
MNVKIISKITDSEGEVNEMTLFTEATYQSKSQKSFLMYDESELSGLEGTKTLLIYDGEKVNIKRYGNVNSNLGIIMDESVENIYRTQYGIFLMHTIGKQIHWNDEDGLHIKMRYQLIIEGDGTQTEVSIEIEEIKN